MKDFEKRIIKVDGEFPIDNKIIEGIAEHFSDAKYILTKKSGFSQIPDGDYVGVVEIDGSYAEYWLTDWGVGGTFTIKKEPTCSYYLGHGLKCNSLAEAVALFKSGEVMSDGGKRNRFFESLQRDSFEITKDDLEWDHDFKYLSQVFEEYLENKEVGY